MHVSLVYLDALNVIHLHLSELGVTKRDIQSFK